MMKCDSVIRCIILFLNVAVQSNGWSLPPGRLAPVENKSHCQQLFVGGVSIGDVCSVVESNNLKIDLNVASQHCSIVEVAVMDMPKVAANDVGDGSVLQLSIPIDTSFPDFMCHSTDDSFLVSGYATVACRGSPATSVHVQPGSSPEASVTGRRLEGEEDATVEIQEMLVFETLLECAAASPSLTASGSKFHFPYCTTAWAWISEKDCTESTNNLKGSNGGAECPSCHDAMPVSLDQAKKYVSSRTSVFTLGPFNFYDNKKKIFSFLAGTNGCETRWSEVVGRVSLDYTRKHVEGEQSNASDEDFLVVSIEELSDDWELESLYFRFSSDATPTTEGSENGEHDTNEGDSLYEFNPAAFPYKHTFRYGEGVREDLIMIEIDNVPKEPAYLSIAGAICKNVN